METRMRFARIELKEAAQWLLRVAIATQIAGLKLFPIGD
jgi:uncharacterized membrane protein YqjE